VRLSGKAAPKPPYTLYAVVDADTSSPRLRAIGSVAADGTPTINGAVDSLPAGTLLFGGKAPPMPTPAEP
jgi:hypothetical protein